MALAAQIISIVAMLFTISSFQCRKNRVLALVLGMGSLLFATSYLLNGLAGEGISNVSIACACFNAGNVVRALLMQGEKTRGNLFFGVSCAVYALGLIPACTNLWVYALFSTEIVGTYLLWYKDGALIRKVQFFFVSPVWLVNNIFFAFNIGGIICEVFVILSVIISLIRFGKDGFEK